MCLVPLPNTSLSHYTDTQYLCIYDHTGLPQYLLEFHSIKQHKNVKPVKMHRSRLGRWLIFHEWRSLVLRAEMLLPGTEGAFLKIGEPRWFFYKVKKRRFV